MSRDYRNSVWIRGGVGRESAIRNILTERGGKSNEKAEYEFNNDKCLFYIDDDGEIRAMYDCTFYATLLKLAFGEIVLLE